METTPTQPSLQSQIENLSSLPLHDLIQNLSHLLPDLTTSISPTGDRLVTHPTYTGTGNLDDLGRLYLQAANRCTSEHAPFKTRLLHITLDSVIGDLYGASHEQLEKGLADKTVTLPPREYEGCACCNGEPYAVILAGFHEQEALMFFEEEYRAFWGDEENTGERYGRDKTWFKASREQVERAMEREVGVIPRL